MYPILDTRVECKGFIGISVICICRIRIEPDWNVKLDIFSCKVIVPHIRIEPDWNVK